MTTKPINLIAGKYYLGTDPLPDDEVERQVALRWYQMGVTDGMIDAAVEAEKTDHALGMRLLGRSATVSYEQDQS